MSTLKDACIELVVVRPGETPSWRVFHFLGEYSAFFVGTGSPESVRGNIKRYKGVAMHCILARRYFPLVPPYPFEQVCDSLREEW
jgi:hypothetical protein